MSLLIALAVILATGGGPIAVGEQEDLVAANPAGPIELGLREGRYPWYDPETGRVKPIWAPKRPWLKWIGQRLESLAKSVERYLSGYRFPRISGPGVSGESVMTAVFLAALIGFLTILINLWSRRGFAEVDRSANGSSIGRAARLADLPEGLQRGSGDPWAEALRRRAAGDLGGAIVCLFAYELLSLDRMGLIRLARGRTGRQYVQAIHDPKFVRSLEATLALFEDVYYGRKLPSLEAFEAVWRSAEVFREHRGVSGI